MAAAGNVDTMCDEFIELEPVVFPALDESFESLDENFYDDPREEDFIPFFTEFRANCTESGEVCSDVTNAIEISDAEPQNSHVRKRRSKTGDPNNWKRNLNKISRMRGKNYLGIRKATQSSSTTYVQDVQRPSRIQGGACLLHNNTTSILKCCAIKEGPRKELFKRFWSDFGWNERKVYVRGLVKQKPAERRSGNESNRTTSFQYFLPNASNTLVRVCRPMFLATFGLTKSTVAYWIKPSPMGIPRPPGRQTRNSNPSPKCSSFTDFLDRLPKAPSHYCRKRTNKLYLEPCVASYSQLYRLYQQDCVEKNEQPISKTMMFRILKTKNVDLFRPKKDLCNTCESYKVGQVSLEDWKSHVMEKERARSEKDFDKIQASRGKCHVIAVDLQATQQSPMLRANCIYYKSKLNVYNYTVYNLGNGRAKCYWWNETQADLSASVFTSLLVDYIETTFTDKLPVIVYSDGCGYQNRNSTMSNGLLNLAMKTQREILQKFLVKGHTQMECDSIHSLVERKLKNVDIRLPSDYMEICKNSRSKPFPIEVAEVGFNFFRNYNSAQILRYSSIRPGNKKSDPKVTDIRALNYLPAGMIKYKLSFDGNWENLPKSVTEISVCVNVPDLFPSALKINARKYKDLQDLKVVIPEDCHSFYDNIPH